MDNQTRHALKSDSFVQATASSVHWLSDHRSGVVRWAILAAAVLLVGGGLCGFVSYRGSSADKALGAAMDIYTAPVAEAGVPAGNGIYANPTERAKAANKEFLAVADNYGFLAQGKKAHYLAGVTYAELGQTAQAESELKTASEAWDRNLANLAKLALANLYHQNNRDAEAIAAYNELIAKPSETISATTAKLDLADLYVATGKQDQARKLWAEIKDADKESAAASVAAQKLAAKN